MTLPLTLTGNWPPYGGPVVRVWGLGLYAGQDALAVTWPDDLRPQAGPASTAATAVMLILIRNMLRAVRQLMPDGNFDVLRNPMVAPSFLADFLGR